LCFYGSKYYQLGSTAQQQQAGGQWQQIHNMQQLQAQQSQQQQQAGGQWQQIHNMQQQQAQQSQQQHPQQQQAGGQWQQMRNMQQQQQKNQQQQHTGGQWQQMQQNLSTPVPTTAETMVTYVVPPIPSSGLVPQQPDAAALDTLPLIINVAGSLGSGLLEGRLPSASSAIALPKVAGAAPQQPPPAEATMSGSGSVTDIPALVVPLPNSQRMLGFSSLNSNPFLLEPVAGAGGSSYMITGLAPSGPAVLDRTVATNGIPPASATNSINLTRRPEITAAPVRVIATGSSSAVLNLQGNPVQARSVWPQPLANAAPSVGLHPGSSLDTVKIEENLLELVEDPLDGDLEDPLAGGVSPPTVPSSMLSSAVSIKRRVIDSASICATFSESLHAGIFDDVLIYTGGVDRRPIACNSVLLAAISPFLARVLANSVRNAAGQFELVAPSLGGASRAELVRLLDQVLKLMMEPPPGSRSSHLPPTQQVDMVMGAELWAFLGHSKEAEKTSVEVAQGKKGGERSNKQGIPLPAVGPQVENRKRPPAKSAHANNTFAPQPRKRPSATTAKRPRAKKPRNSLPPTTLANNEITTSCVSRLLELPNIAVSQSRDDSCATSSTHTGSSMLKQALVSTNLLSSQDASGVSIKSAPSAAEPRAGSGVSLHTVPSKPSDISFEPMASARSGVSKSKLHESSSTIGNTVAAHISRGGDSSAAVTIYDNLDVNVVPVVKVEPDSSDPNNSGCQQR
jgi:hypothetical protein